MDAIFELFYSTKAEKFADISKDLSSNLKKIFKTYQNIDEEDRKTITEMIILFGKVYFEKTTEIKKVELGNIKEHYINEGRKFLEDRKKKV